MKKIIYLFILAIAANLILSSDVSAQIRQRGAATSATSTTTNLQINKPTGVVAGDVMIVNIVKENNVGTNPTLAGWTLVSSGAINSPTNDIRGAVLYKVAGAAEPVNYTFALGASTNDAIGTIVAFSGVDVSGPNPFDAVPSASLSTGGSTTPTAGTATTTTPFAAVIMFGQSGNDNTWSAWSTTSPGALSELYDNFFNSTDDLSVAAAWSLKQTPGATGSGTATLSANDRYGAVLVTLKPIIVANVPIGCNGQFYISHGVSPTDPNDATELEKLSFSGSNIVANSFVTSPSNIGYNAIGLNPIDGYMYGLRYATASERVHLVRIGAGASYVYDLGEVGSATGLGDGENAYAGCFDVAGNYYFITTGHQLYRIAGNNYPATNLTPVSRDQDVTPGFGAGGSNTTNYFVDIAINPITGVMYGVTLNQRLMTIDYADNDGNVAVTKIGADFPGTEYIAGLFFDELGNLYGYRQDGTFHLINKSDATLSPAGTSDEYTAADGCSCSFGRVFHDLDFTKNPGNQVCTFANNPNDPFPLTVTVTNQVSTVQTGLTYTLNLGANDPKKRFRFTQNAATIKAAIVAATLGTNAGTTVTVGPANPGEPNNKLVVTGFQTGAFNTVINFVLQLEVVSPSSGGVFVPIALQSEITGLNPILGGNDLSNDPTSIPPDDATVITFCPQISLPVTLLSFGGSYKNNTTSLDWTAENQVNFSFYSIERSRNGVDFSNIGAKAAQSNPNSNREQYQFTDNLSAEGGNVFYYRLKMIDIDGTFKYSNVIMIRKDQVVKLGMAIAPNPLIRGGMVSVSFDAPAKGTVDFKVIDMAGRTVATQQNNVAEGNNSVTISRLDRLQPGTYLLQMNDGTAIQTAKFTVAR